MEDANSEMFRKYIYIFFFKDIASMIKKGYKIFKKAQIQNKGDGALRFRKRNQFIEQS